MVPSIVLTLHAKLKTQPLPLKISWYIIEKERHVEKIVSIEYKYSHKGAKVRQLHGEELIDSAEELPSGRASQEKVCEKCSRTKRNAPS